MGQFGERATRGPRHYDRIAARIDPMALQSPAKDEDDAASLALRGDLKEDASRLFLGYYTRGGLERALEDYGFLDRLRAKGFSSLRLHLDVGGAGEPPRLRVTGRERTDDEHVLLDLIAHAGRWQDDEGVVREALFIDWLTLRDPRAAFDPKRPRLPGQEYPGLGVGEPVLEMLRQAARRLTLDAVVAYPDRYHNAVLYGRRMRYHDPERQGRLEAMERDRGKHPLAHASWAVEWGLLRDERTGESVDWASMRGEMTLALSDELRARNATSKHAKRTRTVRENARYAFDWDGFEARLARARAEGEAHP